LIEGLHRLFGQNNPEAMETPPASIAEILEPLREAFENKGDKEKGIPGHIDLICEALTEYFINNNPPEEKYNRLRPAKKSKEFYPHFKELHEKLKMPLKMIAEVLQYYIFPGNGSRNGLKESAIIQNIKRRYDKDI